MIYNHTVGVGELQVSWSGNSRERGSSRTVRSKRLVATTAQRTVASSGASPTKLSSISSSAVERMFATHLGCMGNSNIERRTPNWRLKLICLWAAAAETSRGHGTS